MLVPNRNYSVSDDYRYGFQGQENDNEIKGKGNSINYKFRMHDPRVGRFFAVDPMTHQYPWYTPYQFSGNRVIDRIELEGLEESISPDQRAEDICIPCTLYTQFKDAGRNTIIFPLTRFVQSDEQEGEQIRYALGQLGYDKELYDNVSNEELANRFDIRGRGGYKDVFPEKGSGEQLLYFVGDALDMVSLMPTKGGVFAAVKTGIGANTVANILRGLKISTRTRQILDEFVDIGGSGGNFSKVEAEGMAIFEETFNTTVRALKKTDVTKSGDFMVASGKYQGKSVDLVSAVDHPKFDTEKFIKSIDNHYNKTGVDFVNIDIRNLGDAGKKMVKEHVNKMSEVQKSRTIITE